MDRPFRPVERGRRHHVPAGATAVRRRGADDAADRTPSGHGDRGVRALFPGLPVRRLGRAQRRRSSGKRPLRDGRRSVNLSSAFDAAAPLALVGAGKMGGALLSGWLAGGLDPRAVLVLDPAPPADTAAMIAKAGVATHAAPPAGVTARVLVVAVKPQVMAAVLPSLRLL